MSILAKVAEEKQPTSQATTLKKEKSKEKPKEKSKKKKKKPKEKKESASKRFDRLLGEWKEERGRNYDPNVCEVCNKRGWRRVGGIVVCDNCKRNGLVIKTIYMLILVIFRLITITNATSTYLLHKKARNSLPHMSKTNPHYKWAAPMRLVSKKQARVSEIIILL